MQKITYYEVISNIYDLLGELSVYDWAPSIKSDIKLYRKLLIAMLDADKEK